MVGVGDEGFICGPDFCPGGNCGCDKGVDFATFTALPNIDYGSAHLYPSSWGGQSAEWGAEWIANHTRIAKDLDKPFVLGEFGWAPGGSPSQAEVYAQWAQTANSSSTAGMEFWMLCGRTDSTASGDNGNPDFVSNALTQRSHRSNQ